MQGKGRLQVGADADITVFDPAQYSEGIPYVLAHDVFVVKDGQVQDGGAGAGVAAAGGGWGRSDAWPARRQARLRVQGQFARRIQYIGAASP